MNNTMSIIVIAALETPTERLAAAKNADNAWNEAQFHMRGWERHDRKCRNPFRLILRAAELGHPTAQREAERYYRSGVYGFPVDYSEAYKWARHMVDVDIHDPYALITLSQYYTEGWGPVDRSDINFEIGMAMIGEAHMSAHYDYGHSGVYDELVRLVRRFHVTPQCVNSGDVWTSLHRGDYIVKVKIKEKKHFRRRR